MATAWVISHVPSTFRRMTVRKPLGFTSSAGVRYCPPALFTSRSILPWRSSAPSTSAATWSSSRMSHCTASNRPAAAIPAVSSSGSLRRPQPTTVIPSRVSSSAVSRPSPEPAPLTIPTWPSSRPSRKISGRAHFPFQCGSRFSMNAVTPSTTSSVDSAIDRLPRR